jgi:hypothetical protein
MEITAEIGGPFEIVDRLTDHFLEGDRISVGPNFMEPSSHRPVFGLSAATWV